MGSYVGLARVRPASISVTATERIILSCRPLPPPLKSWIQVTKLQSYDNITIEPCRGEVSDLPSWW